jgi:O-antigen ligase
MISGDWAAVPLTSFLLLALLPALFALGLYGLRRPAVFLALYAVIIPMGSSVSLPIPLPPPFHTLSTFGGLVAAAGLLTYLLVIGGERTPQFSRAVPMWVLFLGATTASALWSVDTAQTQSYLMVLASLMLLYLVTATIRWTAGDRRLIEHGLMLSGAITGAYAVYLQATGQMHLTGAGWPRFQTAGGGGEGGDPNVTAAALLLPFVVAIHGMFDEGASRTVRAVYLVAASLTAGAIVLTGSRGGLLGLAVAVITLAVTEPRPRSRLALAVVPLTILTLSILVAPGFIQSRIQAEHSSGRTEVWQVALRACPDVCIVGGGWGTFNRVFSEAVLEQAEANTDKVSIGSHNLWVRTLIELGVVGTLLLLATFGITLRELFALPRSVRGPPLAALLGQFVVQTFLGNLDFKYFWMVLIYCLMTVQITRTSPPVPAHSPEPSTRGAATVTG